MVIKNRLEEWLTRAPYHKPDMPGFRSERRKAIENFFEKNGLKLVMYDCDISEDDIF